MRKTNLEDTPLLRSLAILRERIRVPDRYPFTVPTIATLDTLELRSRLTFFVGENGTGKSTLLEGIARACGFNAMGGSENIHGLSSGVGEETPAGRLAETLRLSWKKKLNTGFFLRAESFYNVATKLDELQRDDARTLLAYGGTSLHKRSHGEAFLALAEARFDRAGIYLLDEPEAALSPQRQLAFLVLLARALRARDTQFIIATHSPILLALPGADILSFDGNTIRRTTYRETEAFKITSSFTANPEAYLRHLLG